jgi:universal stress protein A
MLHIQSILWPSDESENSIRALNTAVELAKQFGARLYALTVLPEVPVSTDTTLPMTVSEIQQYEGNLKKSAEKKLKQNFTTQITDIIRVETFVESGKPADVIIKFAKEKKVDLVVMATHARKGVSHFLIGSVTEDTIRHSAIPVLVVPEPDNR